jgi:hypothetical protein
MSPLRAASWLLISGWLIFWAGAVTPPWRWWYAIPVDEYLRLIAAHRTTWLVIAALFALGSLLTLAGVTLLAPELRAAGDTRWSRLAEVALVVGTIGWLAALAFRATATITAAMELGASGSVPSWFVPVRSWTGALFGLYMVLAYLAIAGLGAALLATPLVPRWVGWAHLVFGLAGAVGFVARIPLFDPPLMIPLLPGILGVMLLLQSRGS